MHYYITQEGLDFVEEGKRLRTLAAVAPLCVGAACSPADQQTAGPPGGGSPIRTAVTAAVKSHARHGLAKAQDVVAGGGEYTTKSGKPAVSTTTPEQLANIARFARGERFTPHREPTTSVAPRGYISRARQAAADVIAPAKGPSTRVVTSRGPRVGTKTEIGKGTPVARKGKNLAGEPVMKVHTPSRTRFVPTESDPGTRRFPGGPRASGRPSARAIMDAPRHRPGGTAMQRTMIKRGKR
jgi:hypothetical protein